MTQTRTERYHLLLNQPKQSVTVHAHPFTPLRWVTAHQNHTSTQGRGTTRTMKIFLMFRSLNKNTHQAKAKFSLLSCLLQPGTDLVTNMRVRAVFQGLNTRTDASTHIPYSTHLQYNLPCNVLAPQGRIDGKISPQENTCLFYQSLTPSTLLPQHHQFQASQTQLLLASPANPTCALDLPVAFHPIPHPWIVSFPPMQLTDSVLNCRPCSTAPQNPRRTPRTRHTCCYFWCSRHTL